MQKIRVRGWNKSISCYGDTSIASLHKTAFLCSRSYPASIVLRIYSWAKEVRERGECIISGFHSPLEKDALDILLGGKQPIIFAAPRGLPKRYPPVLRRAIEDGRMLALSPFDEKVMRITVTTAQARNKFMIKISQRIVVAAAPDESRIIQSLKVARPDQEVLRLGKLLT